MGIQYYVVLSRSMRMSTLRSMYQKYWMRMMMMIIKRRI